MPPSPAPRRLLSPGLLLWALLASLPLVGTAPQEVPQEAPKKQEAKKKPDSAEDAELLKMLQEAEEFAQEPQLPEGPTWGDLPARPRDANVVFATSDGCAICHEGAEGARAMRDAEGKDVSPYRHWHASIMANSFRDPYFRAALAQESERHPERYRETEALCIRCHAPMASHTARLGKVTSPSFEDLEYDPLATDGVSCTVCHQAGPKHLGTEKSFDGQLDITFGRRIYGPYPEPFPGPMFRDTAYMPVHGPHVIRSSFCGSCHTLHTTEPHSGTRFPEQTPYLEWRNSIYSDEDELTVTSQTCQDCHMASLGDQRIARTPIGTDYGFPPRPDARAHTFVGANAFMLEMLADNAEELDVTAGIEDLGEVARATRRFLRTKTARLSLDAVERQGHRLRFDLAIENLAGHKLPTAYPSRRAWLEVVVRAGGRVVFASGTSDAQGRIKRLADPRASPHRDRITAPDQVQIYEGVPVDREGKPTTTLTAMSGWRKDNRLLPKGWREEGPHADETRPVAVEGDDDFGPGGDRVTYDLTLPSNVTGPLVVDVRFVLQTIPPPWVDALRDLEHEDVARFLSLYDARPPLPELLAELRREIP